MRAKDAKKGCVPFFPVFVKKGNGRANTNCIIAGSDGINNSSISGDDTYILQPGNGSPDKVCISAAADGVLHSVKSGDDDYTSDGKAIHTGANGICDSALVADDIQVIPFGKGMPGAACISTGADGIRQSASSGDDCPLFPVNEGEPFQDCIGPGNNGILDSQNSPQRGGDDALTGGCVNTGANGICESSNGDSNIPVPSISAKVPDIVDRLNNKVYNQTGVEWIISELDTCCYFDLNANHYFDISNTEALPIVTSCIGQSRAYDFYLFFVGNSLTFINGQPSYGVMGWMPGTEGFVFPNCSPDYEVTVPHELGHGINGWLHAPATTRLQDKSHNQTDNLMYYQYDNPTITPLWKLFHDQWQDVRTNLPPLILDATRK